MEHFSFLPGEITLDILCRLPAESILQCKSVSKAWNYLVSHHPSLYKLQLHHLSTAEDFCKLNFIASTRTEIWDIEKYHYSEYNQNHESIQRIRRFNFTPPLRRPSLICSCNGLICLVNYSSVCICNPITKEYVSLPEFNTDHCDNQYYNRVSGFGYVSSTNEYKFVKILMLRTTRFVEVHIYTLGSGNGWRNLGQFNHEFNPIHQEPGIFANGVLYWISRNSEIIISFDLVEEKICENLSPPLNCYGYNRIGILDGVLFVAIDLIGNGANCYEIWLLNDNHDMNEGEEHQPFGWTKEFRFDEGRLLAVTKSGDALTYTDNYLNIYDTKGSTSTRLVDFEESIRRVFRHKHTLVSLKELGEEDTKIMESDEIERKIAVISL